MRMGFWEGYGFSVTASGFSNDGLQPLRGTTYIAYGFLGSFSLTVSGFSNDGLQPLRGTTYIASRFWEGYGFSRTASGFSNDGLQPLRGTTYIAYGFLGRVRLQPYRKVLLNQGALAVAKCYQTPQSLFINLEGIAKLSDHSVGGLNHG